MKTLFTLVAILLVSACSSSNQYERCHQYTDEIERAACITGVDSEIAVKQHDAEAGPQNTVHLPPMNGPSSAQPSNY